MDTVNDAVAARKFISLTGEICLTCNALPLGNKVKHIGSYRRYEPVYVNTNKGSIPLGAAIVPIRKICRVIKQKSAEAIVTQHLE